METCYDGLQVNHLKFGSLHLQHDMVALINVNLVFDRDPIHAPHLYKQLAHRTKRYIAVTIVCRPKQRCTVDKIHFTHVNVKAWRPRLLFSTAVTAVS